MSGKTGKESFCSFLDASDIDLKGEDAFYKKYAERDCGCAGYHKANKRVRNLDRNNHIDHPSHSNAEKGINGIIDFILSVDPAIPWQVSQFYPTHELTDVPRTPVDTLQWVRETGFKRGIRYVYG